MKNFKTSAKLFVGFGVTVTFILVVGLVSVFSMNRINKQYHQAIEVHGKQLANAGILLETIHSLRADTRALVIYTGDPEKVSKTRNEMEALFKAFEAAAEPYGKSITSPDDKAWFTEAMDKYEKVFKPSALAIENAAGKGAPAAELMSQIVSVTRPAADLIAANMKKCMEMKLNMLTAAENAGSAHYMTLFIIISLLIAVCVTVSIIFGRHISGIIGKPLGEVVKMMSEIGRGHLGKRLNLNRRDEIGVMADMMDKFAEDLRIMLIGTMNRISDGEISMNVPNTDADDELGAALKKMVTSLKGVVDTMKKISVGDLGMKIELKNDKDEVSVALKKTVESLHNLIIDDGGRVLQAAADKDLSQRLTGDYTGEFAIMRDNINTVMRNLDDALVQVSDAVTNVAGASEEISDGANNLAQGSNEQAASLEEVSASLEEMSSMTKQNADSSNHATILASEARAAADRGDFSMKRMAEAIRQIKASADDTAKIIKSIDDIAFQTNLLALNAAVEAARAGEAGKGFAVVAEEVRNLAQRSADAAKSTADMIAESVKNADGGVKITEEVAQSLVQIVDRTTKVGDLVAEIAAASKEQAQGIEQVNTAVAQMNRITQNNASNSEESASAAEELNGQATELANMVSAFKLSNGGHDDNGGVRHQAAERHAPHARRLPSPKQVAAIRDRLGRQKDREARAEIIPLTHTKTAAVKAVMAEEIIQLDDNDMREF